jgi:hypothetical protein
VVGESDGPAGEVHVGDGNRIARDRWDDGHCAPNFGQRTNRPESTQVANDWVHERTAVAWRDRHWRRRQAMFAANGTRYYGDGGTIHSSGHLDVTVYKGRVVAVWFRCQPLPFEQHNADLHRAAEIDAMYERLGVELHAVEVKDDGWSQGNRKRVTAVRLNVGRKTSFKGKALRDLALRTAPRYRTDRMLAPDFSPAAVAVRIFRCGYVIKCKARSCRRRASVVAEKVDSAGRHILCAGPERACPTLCVARSLVVRFEEP